MFFYKKHFYAFQLKASSLGSTLKEKVKKETRDQLEGNCLGTLGYLIKILDTSDDEIQLGLIDNDTGGVNVIVWYMAIFFRPFANEVLDAVVVTSNNTVRLIESCFEPCVQGILIFQCRKDSCVA
jgi:DNA-directed RNA polymerase subunit E'/Rpb7